MALLDCQYSRAIYFDTFPDVSGLDPVVETETNIAIMDALWQVARELRDDSELARAMAGHDAALSQRIVAQALYRRD